jgi:hypothetical protein
MQTWVYNSTGRPEAGICQPLLLCTPPPAPQTLAPRPATMQRRQERSHRSCICAAVAAPPQQQHARAAEGHSALLQGLGEVGDVAPTLMPWLLRLSHIRCCSVALPSHADQSTHAWSARGGDDIMIRMKCRARVQGGDSNEALKENARGILLWKVHLFACPTSPMLACMRAAQGPRTCVSGCCA